MADYLAKTGQKEVPSDFSDVGRFWGASRVIDHPIAKVLISQSQAEVLFSIFRDKRLISGTHVNGTTGYVLTGSRYMGDILFELYRDAPQPCKSSVRNWLHNHHYAALFLETLSETSALPPSEHRSLNNSFLNRHGLWNAKNTWDRRCPGGPLDFCAYRWGRSSSVSQASVAALLLLETDDLTRFHYAGALNMEYLRVPPCTTRYMSRKGTLCPTKS